MLYQIPWYVAFFQSMPETFFVIAVGLRLYNIKIDSKYIFIISFVTGMVGYYIRKISFSLDNGILFGVHTILTIITIAIFIKIIIGTKWTNIFVPIITSALIMGVIQSITLPLFLNIIDKTIEDLITYPYLNIWTAIPGFIIMIVLYYIVEKKNLYIFDLKGEKGIDNNV